MGHERGTPVAIFIGEGTDRPSGRLGGDRVGEVGREEEEDEGEAPERG